MKCVGLEVACFLSIDASGSQVTCYNARPDIVIKLRNRTNCGVLATGEVSRSPIVQTNIAALGYLARSGSKYILCIVLHKNNSINLYLGVNQRKTVIDSEYFGPISLVSLMGGESYDLHNEAKVITLIKHLGSALKKIAVRNVRDRCQTRPGTSEDESPSKRRHEVAKYFDKNYYVLLCIQYSQISLQNFILYCDHTQKKKLKSQWIVFFTIQILE